MAKLLKMLREASWKLIYKFLEPIVISTFVPIAKARLTGVLELWYKSQPDYAKTSITTLYPIIDVVLEDEVTKTWIELDNAMVTAAKQICEDLATNWGIRLPNLDEDQVVFSLPTPQYKK